MKENRKTYLEDAAYRRVKSMLENIFEAIVGILEIAGDVLGTIAYYCADSFWID